MPHLTTAHLQPLARALATALDEGTIPLEEAMRFVEAAEAAVLEHRVKNEERRRPLPSPPKPTRR